MPNLSASSNKMSGFVDKEGTGDVSRAFNSLLKYP